MLASVHVSRFKPYILAHTLPDRLLRHDALRDEDVDQSLQRFHVFLRQQIVVHRHGNEVHKARVQLQVSVDVPEWVVPVTVVQMSVAAEHLLDDALDVGVIICWEPARLADPIVPSDAGKGGKRLVEVCWGCGYGWLRGGGGGIAIAGRRDFARRIRREDDRVVDLAHDPFLYADDVAGGGDFGRAAVLEPGVGQAACGHGGAGVVVTDGVAGVRVGFLDNLDHAGEEAVHFDNCGV